MKICYFTTLILLTSLKINIYTLCGQSGREEGPSTGHWRLLVAIPRSVFPEKPAALPELKPESARDSKGEQFLKASLLHTRQFITPRMAGILQEKRKL